MFSRRITDSAKFLKMGGGAQLLYFHLCMHADDDGVVEAFTVKRGIGANDDDMQNLIGRGFVRMLDQENEILLITDWYEHNKIRKDRITPSMYRDLIARQAPDIMLIEPTQRKDRIRGAIDVSPVQEVAATSECQPDDDNGTSQGQPDGNHGTTDGQPSVNQMSAQDKLSKDKLSKVKKSKDNPTGQRKRFSPPTIDECREYYREKGFGFDLDFFYNYFTELKWHDGNGKQVKSWKAKMLTWQRNFEQRNHGRNEPAVVQHGDNGQVPSYWEV